ncbi:MAG: GNAT family N-acetyltransferase [Anaerolineaceae bacterium]|nr:GNAT family N-acetyltransferase [Anaerolineaceae bacterium]
MITYTDSLEGLTADQLNGFFVGWPNPPTSETHLRMLRGSDHLWLAKEGERVVGFVTAISDGVLAAFIPAIEVLPDYQGRGIGSQLMERMLGSLVHLYSIDLICDESVQPFYKYVGMQHYSAMILRNYDNQLGYMGDGD